MDGKVVRLNHETACRQCAAKGYLLAKHCSPQSIADLANIVQHVGPIPAGHRIFQAGQHPRAIYVVRSGVIKCERVAANGGIHVAGFYLAGDLIGCEDIGVAEHSYDAVALEECWVCEIPLEELTELFSTHPDLQYAFLMSISERIRNSEMMLTNSFHMRAKHRLLNFLNDFYQRLSLLKQQVSRAIVLPMSKIDIANHLGISPETLSRLLRELEEEKQIRNGAGQIELIDPDNLMRQYGS